MTKSSKLVTIEQYRLLQAGVTDKLPPKVPIVLVGESLAPKDIVARIQARIDLATETAAAKTAYHKAVQAEATADADVSGIRDALQTHVQTLYGKKSADLKFFGFEPTKPRKVSASTVADAVEKAAKTRAENGTMGKKQRKEAKVAREAAGAGPAPVVNPAPQAAASQAPQPAVVSQPAAAEGPQPAVPSTPTNGTSNHGAS